mgnify:CR=1 FL=1
MLPEKYNQVYLPGLSAFDDYGIGTVEPWKKAEELKLDFFDLIKQKGDIRNLMIRSTTTCLLYTSPSPRDQRGSGMAGSG